jgi:hypothetical protein
MAYGRISLEQALNSDNFYQLPKVVIKSKYYRKLKAEAKLMFMLKVTYDSWMTWAIFLFITTLRTCLKTLVVVEIKS